MSYLPNMVGSNADYSPGVGPFVPGRTEVTIDPSGQQKVRGPILTDEGSWRANFCNSSLDVSIGNCTFTNGSTLVTLQTGSFSQYDLHVGDYVYPTSAGSSYAVQVESLDDTQLWLSSAWATTTVTNGAANRRVMQGKAGVGGALAVANGVCVLTSGTTISDVVELERDVDYLPLTTSSRLTLSAAPGATQTVYYGFYDETLTPTKTFARFKFTGTGVVSVIAETGWNATGTVTANETESSTILFSQGASATPITSAHDYRIDVLKDKVLYWVDGKIVATHRRVVPHQHDELTNTVQIINGASGLSSFTVTVDYVNCSNYNSVIVDTNENATVQSLTAPQLTLPIWAPNSTNPLIIDCNGYQSLSFNIPSAGTASVLTPAWSNDGVTYAATSYAFLPAAGGAYVTTITNATAGLWTAPVLGRYLRLSAASTQTGGVVISLLPTQWSGQNPTTTVTASNLSCNVAQVGGTNTVTGGLAGTLAIGGQIAHDSAMTLTYKPVAVGGVAKTTNFATTIADNDCVFAAYAQNGAATNKPYSVPDLDWAYAAASGGINASTADVTLKAGTASYRTFVTAITLINTSTTDTEFVIKEGTNVIWRTMLDGHAANTGGIPQEIAFPTPLKGAAGATIYGACVSSVNAVYVNAQGYTAL